MKWYVTNDIIDFYWETLNGVALFQNYSYEVLSHTWCFVHRGDVHIPSSMFLNVIYNTFKKKNHNSYIMQHVRFG